MVSPGEAVTAAPRETLLYKFYRKEMASPFQILSRSAVTETIKVSTAVNEILRRWKTTSESCWQKALTG